ncbi:MAG: glycosyl transferase family 2 [Herbinix sp.]|jgi:GT2 family glycosyltransferase/precorrin-6B methylase 2|nr:glycosyl transferase family 2 [Herbinix sp.]
MRERIKRLLLHKEFAKARKRMDEYIKVGNLYDDEIAILDATIYDSEGDEVGLFCSIKKGLEFNHRNYELYFMLGNYYAGINPNQAYLCYENALFYCDNQDVQIIEQQVLTLEKTAAIEVKKVAIVILSYNGYQITKQCIESIRNNTSKQSYELVVIDNASTDLSIKWLKDQKDIKLICNLENKGFPEGCNQGILLAEKESDILLLNNDTLVPENAIFWLRMGLYENELVGATGSVSNSCPNYQTISEQGVTNQNYADIARKYNVPLIAPYEEKSWLVGFALLIKRSALDQVGLLDARFTPGNFEDNDICFRILEAGFNIRLCLNSFIYHYGSTSFNKDKEKFLALLETNERKFIEKWGFHPSKYTYIKKEVIELIRQHTYDQFSVLDIGCGAGATLARIQRNYPNTLLEGLEKNEQAAHIAKLLFPVKCGDIETIGISESKIYDYIILSGVMEHLHEPDKVLKKIRKHLKPGGRLLLSAYNIMYISALYQIIQGKFYYGTLEALNKEHIRYFTGQDLITLLEECGYTICDFTYTESPYKLTKEEEDYLVLLSSKQENKKLHEAYQFIVSATW